MTSLAVDDLLAGTEGDDRYFHHLDNFGQLIELVPIPYGGVFTHAMGFVMVEQRVLVAVQDFGVYGAVLEYDNTLQFVRELFVAPDANDPNMNPYGESQSELNAIQSLTKDDDNYLYISAQTTNRNELWKYDSEGNFVETFKVYTATGDENDGFAWNIQHRPNTCQLIKTRQKSNETNVSGDARTAVISRWDKCVHENVPYIQLFTVDGTSPTNAAQPNQLEGDFDSQGNFYTTFGHLRIGATPTTTIQNYLVVIDVNDSVSIYPINKPNNDDTFSVIRAPRLTNDGAKAWLVPVRNSPQYGSIYQIEIDTQAQVLPTIIVSPTSNLSALFVIKAHLVEFLPSRVVRVNFIA